jgi:hypothetical protein
MLAVGSAVTVTLVVAVTAAQPAAASVEYVMVYVPGVLMLGLISPVDALMLNPAGAENVPPVYAAVPLRVTGAEVAEVQYGVPAYAMVAVGSAVTVTLVVAVTAAQPPAASVVYVTVYVLGVLVLGLISPVAALMVSPAGAV